VVIFANSEDEYYSLGGDWKSRVFVSQAEALKNIAHSLQNKLDTHIYYRMHPNLSWIVNDAVIRERDLASKLENVTLIVPEDETSTYELMRHSTVNISCGGTTGIESIYMKKPTILIGMAAYSAIPGISFPNSLEEFKKQLEDVLNGTVLNNEDEMKKGSEVYSNYLLQRGRKSKFLIQDGSNLKYYKNIQRNLYFRTLIKFTSILEILQSRNMFLMYIRNLFSSDFRRRAYPLLKVLFK